MRSAELMAELFAFRFRFGMDFFVRSFLRFDIVALRMKRHVCILAVANVYYRTRGTDMFQSHMDIIYAQDGNKMAISCNIK